MILLTLTLTQAPRPGGEPRVYHEHQVEVPDIQAALAVVTDEFGMKIPRRPRGIFIELNSGGSRQTGIIIAGWDRYDSGKYFWRETWVMFTPRTGETLELPKQLKAKQ